MKKILLSIVCGAALLCAFGFRAQADSSILTDSGTGGIFDFNINETFGFDFTVGPTPLTITALGMWDGPESVSGGGFTGSVGDGFASTHQIGLWDNSGNLLATSTMQIGTADTLIGEFRYSSVLVPTNPGPVILAANTTYVLGATYLTNDGDSLKRSLGPASPTYDPAVSAGHERVGGPFVFPQPASSPGAWVGPNATFTTPDSGSAWLLMVMAVGVIVFARESAAKRGAK